MAHHEMSYFHTVEGSHGDRHHPADNVPPVQTGSAILDRFARGFEKFHARNYRCECCHRNIGQCFQKNIDNGQHPKALMLYCSDSRSNSTDLFATEAGEIFSNSTVATLIPPQGHFEGSATWAAIEYAVEHLHVPAIFLLGHTQCGGIKALVESSEKNSRIPGALGHWLEEAQEIVESARKRFAPKTHAELVTAVEKENILWGMRNISDYLDRQFADRPEKRPELHGLLFHMGMGNIFRVVDMEAGEFGPLTLLPVRTDRGHTPPECPDHSRDFFALHPALLPVADAPEAEMAEEEVAA